MNDKLVVLLIEDDPSECEAIQKYVESNGYSVVRDLVGHGIGTHLRGGRKAAEMRKGAFL